MTQSAPASITGVKRARGRGGAAADPAAIRAAALALFAERGYRATTMADIGAAVGLRGPSLYRHVASKQQLLAEIMIATMNALVSEQRVAIEAGGGTIQRLRRMVEAHVRFHATNRAQAVVGNREIDNLELVNRAVVLGLRRTYEHGFRSLLERAARTGDLSVANPRLASYAILDMGVGVATWFRPDGPHTANEIAYTHADYAVAFLTAAQ